MKIGSLGLNVFCSLARVILTERASHAELGRRSEMSGLSARISHLELEQNLWIYRVIYNKAATPNDWSM